MVSFGGTDVTNNEYIFPSGEESWAGFANDNCDIYSLNFVNGGRVILMSIY